MAPNLKIINNNKGQALLESVFQLLVVGTFLYFMLRCFLYLIFTVALDAMAEDYFFCELTDEEHCEQILVDRLHNNQMKDVYVNVDKRGSKKVLSITATHLQTVSITREFDYEKFDKKF